MPRKVNFLKERFLRDSAMRAISSGDRPSSASAMVPVQWVWGRVHEYYDDKEERGNRVESRSFTAAKATHALVPMPYESCVCKGKCAFAVCRAWGAMLERQTPPFFFLGPLLTTQRENGVGRAALHIPASPSTHIGRVWHGMEALEVSLLRVGWMSRRKTRDDKRSSGREAAKGAWGVADDDRTRTQHMACL